MDYNKLRSDIIMKGITEHRLTDTLHRTNGPAVSFTMDTGLYESWALFSENHRYYGPAAIVAGHSLWWIHGKHIK